MSLNYDYIFSQIDKAKKKKPKHYVPWNSPESKKLQATAEETEKKRQDKIESTGGRVSQRRYRRNPGGKNKPETHREGTTKPYKDEEPQSNPRQGSGQQGAHSSLSNLTEEERAKKRSEAEEDSKRNKKLSPKEREAKRRRGKIQISDLEEGKSHGDPDYKKVDATYKKIQEAKIRSAEHRKKEEEEKKKEKPTWASGIRDIQSESENPAPGKQRAGGGGLSSSPHLDEKTLEEKLDEGRRGLSRPTVRDADEADAKAEDEKRTEKLERLREAAGRKTGIRGHETLEPGWWKKQDPKGEKKKDPKPKGLQGGDEHVEEVQ